MNARKIITSIWQILEIIHENKTLQLVKAKKNT